MTTTGPLSSLPTERPRGCPFDPPAELQRLRAERPLSGLGYPDGHTGWLVTSLRSARAVLADPRFSVRTELLHMPLARAGIPTKPQPALPGVLTQTDPPEHTRYRHLLTGQFTVRRMRSLTERIEQITAERLDAMAAHGAPVDLVESFAQPIPALVICELLGVPEADRNRFHRQMNAMISLDSTPEELTNAVLAARDYIHDLVAAKRARPTDDLLTGLTETDLTDEELTNIGFTLLGAGLDTTANMIALGTFALLRHPGQLTALRDDPELVDHAIEELLRYLSIVPFTVRTALEDVELDGQLIKAGQTVTISIPTADRDPAHFDDPDVLDLHRHAGGHVAFGHGVHQCLGQQLARVEMRVTFPALLRRFPTLRLAVEPQEVPLRTNMLIYGVHHLPVAWEA